MLWLMARLMFRLFILFPVLLVALLLIFLLIMFLLIHNDNYLHCV